VIRRGQLYTSNIFYLENKYYFCHFEIYRGGHDPISLKEAPPLVVSLNLIGQLSCRTMVTERNNFSFTFILHLIFCGEIGGPCLNIRSSNLLNSPNFVDIYFFYVEHPVDIQCCHLNDAIHIIRRRYR
jgi:hypothetical protein